MKQVYKLLMLCLVFLTAQMAYGQGRTVSGKVVGTDGKPVEGVTVLVSNTGIGTVTDDKGAYSITVPKGNNELQFVFIGYKTQKVTLGTSDKLDVTLEADTYGMEETVITAVGVKKQVKALGFATTEVKAKQLTEVGERSMLNSLQGKVAGVNISQNSGDPGASTQILIRGVSSMTQGNQPLFVIDGVPMTNTSINSTSIETSGGGDALNQGFDFGNSANAVNPEDIESINILKGAAATALYGSRAANGAVIITTKKSSYAKAGEKTPLGVSYSGNLTFSRLLKGPTFQNKFGNGWDGNNWLDENGSWGPIMDGRDRVWGRVVDNSQQIKPNVAQPDNYKDFFETGVGRTNHVALTGGDDKSSFYASFSNFDQDGIIPTDVDKYTRNTVALRASRKVRWLNVSSSMNYSQTDNSFSPTGQNGSSITNNLMNMPRDLQFTDFRDYKAKFNNINDYFTPYGATNPYWGIYENSSVSNTDKFFGNVEASAKVRNHWNLLYRFGFDVNKSNADISRAILLPVGPNDGSVNDPGFVSNFNYSSEQLNHDFLANYEKQLNKNLGVSGFIGLNINQRSSNSLYSSVTGLDIAGFYNLKNSSATPLVTQSSTLRRLIGTFGQVAFDYKSYLFLNLSVRRDVSSTLPTDNNSFTYPAANLSFVFTDIVSKSIKDIVNFGKVRLGYGQTGNDAPVYIVNPVFVGGEIDMPFRTINFPVTNGSAKVNGFEKGNTLGNPGLQPEITTELEIGADLRFLKNRLGVDVTWYKRNTDNQIFVVPLSPASGYTAQYLNVAEVQNKGWEILVNGKIMKSKKKDGFNWNASFNFTKNDNEVIDLADGVDKFAIGGLSTVGYFAVEGEPIGVFEGRVPKTVEIDGVTKTVVDGAGVPVAATDKVFYGNSQYDFIMGLSNSFSYKDFSLGFNFDFRNGGLMYSNTADITYWTGNNVKTTYNDRKPFVYPNSVVETGVDAEGNPTYAENTTIVDPAHMDDFTNTNAFERNTVIDRSFIKLRDLVISYKLPEKISGKVNATDMTVSIVGRNLLLFTPTDNQFVDPEVSSFGTGLEYGFGEFNANPSSRSIGVALRANF